MKKIKERLLLLIVLVACFQTLMISDCHFLTLSHAQVVDPLKRKVLVGTIIDVTFADALDDAPPWMAKIIVKDRFDQSIEILVTKGTLIRNSRWTVKTVTYLASIKRVKVNYYIDEDGRNVAKEIYGQKSFK